MKNLSTIILKSGIHSLIYESEDAFKKSLTNSLSFKLNEALKEVHKNTSAGLFHAEDVTEITEDIKNLINFLENYEIKSTNRFTFKNNTSINISEQDAKKIKVLFNSLNSKNRKIMAKTLFEDLQGFKKTLEFYENAKKVIK